MKEIKTDSFKKLADQNVYPPVPGEEPSSMFQIEDDGRQLHKDEDRRPKKKKSLKRTKKHHQQRGL
jgi:hypothetical protein